MEETIKKEIQKCELADVFIDAFLSPQHAALAFMSALQMRQVPNVADLFNSEQIEAAAAITKKVSVLINLQTFAPIRADEQHRGIANVLTRSSRLQFVRL